MSGSTTACRFCGAMGVKLTKEHVYPRWLHRAMGIQGGIEYSTDGKLKRAVSELDVQIADVCESCNSGWLHDLEKAFRAVMIWPINGLGPIPLTTDTQLVVALWAVKTWLLIEQSMAYLRNEPVLDPGPDVFRWIREHSEPEPTTQVWIGAIADAIPERLISHVATRWVRTPPNPPIGISGVFTIGCVLFQVYMPVQWGEAVTQPFWLGLGPRLIDFLVPIWPPSADEIEWPPAGILQVADLDTIWPSGDFIRPGPPPN